ncbi:uncharacterized protein LOC117826737 [Notolabrus celidotus]|uniref:uncharacterized protein LOC117826737 n=1 Tax=Notolabrus celidotus TaxID=1203425 RepID=UPI00148FB7D6|nr:uncharacterized protein LOC117826737 [Notolabrus celidotus]
MDKLAAAAVFMVLTLLGNTLEDDITASSAEVLSSEGDDVTLSCNYSVKANDLQWYQQDPGSPPKFLLLITNTPDPSVVTAKPPHPGLTVNLNEERNRVNLQISSAALSDSAVYYCALRPTVTGNTNTLYKNTTCVSCEDLTAERKEESALENSSVTLSFRYSRQATAADELYWYHQDPGEPPQFLISHLGTGTPLSECKGEDRVIQTAGDVTALEGDPVTLECSFETSSGSPTLFWYKQGVGDFPKYMLKLYAECKGEERATQPSGEVVATEGDNVTLESRRRLGFNILEQWKNIIIIICWNSEDMFLYSFLLFYHFIALASMVTIKPESTEEHVEEGRNINLTCSYEGLINNIQWYRQNQGTRPEFLLYITEDRSIHPPDSGFLADINKEEKRVDLEISSAALTDSAVYYCALRPTVTGNTNTLYKNLWSKHNTILHNIH